MGTWDTGPFENDAAADFANDLDDAQEDAREELVRAALTRAVLTRDYLEGPDGDEAFAAAALVASQCPGGEPVSASYGPDEPLPQLAADLRALAVRALDRVVAEDSELVALWEDSPKGPAWRAGVARVRAVLEAAR